MDLIFPAYSLKTKKENGKELVWDIIRRKWIVLQKEEHIRQLMIHHMIQALGVSPALISVEKEIRYLSLRKRFDVVIYDRRGRPFILCECKSPDIELDQKILNQIARYNQTLKAPHLLITNGLSWLFFSLNENGNHILKEEGWYE